MLATWLRQGRRCYWRYSPTYVNVWRRHAVVIAGCPGPCRRQTGKVELQVCRRHFAVNRRYRCYGKSARFVRLFHPVNKLIDIYLNFLRAQLSEIQRFLAKHSEEPFVNSGYSLIYPLTCYCYRAKIAFQLHDRNNALHRPSLRIRLISGMQLSNHVSMLTRGCLRQPPTGIHIEK